MPVYNINGKKIRTEVALSDEQIDEIASELGQEVTKEHLPSSFFDQYKQAIQSYEEKRPKGIEQTQAGAVRGLIDPFVGAAQIGLEASGQGGLGSKMVKGYKEAVGTSNTVGELLGSLANPINSVLGPLAGVSKAATVGRAVGAGAIQGVLQPTDNTESFWSDKAFNAGLGALISGAFPIASIGSKKLKDIVSNVHLTEASRMNEIRKYLTEVIGPEKNKIIAELKNAGELVAGSKPTAAQVVSHEPTSLMLSAVEQQLAKKQDLASQFAAREATQQEARKAALQGIATPDQRTIVQLEKTRKEVTDDLRNKALSKANKYGTEGIDLEKKLADREQSFVSALQGEGKMATEEAQALNRAHNWTPVPGYPRFPGRYSPNMDRAMEYQQAAKEFGNVVDTRKADINVIKEQIKSLNERGYFPLSPKSIIERLSKAKNIAGNRANSELSAVYEDTISKLQSLTNARGVIDSNDLYQVRKDLGKDMIASLQKRNMLPDEKRIAGIERSIQKLIDTSIEQAGAKGMWSKYLDKYGQYSKIIDRRKLGEALVEKLKGNFNPEQAGAFVSAIRNSRPLVTAATGKTYPGTIEKILTPKEMSTVNSVIADLTRAKQSKELAGKITLEGETNMPSVTIFNQTVTATKDLLRYIREGKRKEVDKKTAELLLDPQKLGVFLETIPKGKFDSFVPLWLKTLSPDMVNTIMSHLGIATTGVVTE